MSLLLFIVGLFFIFDLTF